MTDRSQLLDQLAIPAHSREAKPKPWPWIFGALAAAAIGYGVWSFAANSQQMPLVGVVTATSAAQTANGGAVLEGSGYVVARRQATVSAKSTGKLLQVFIEEGMEVEQGQILAQLEPVNVSAQLQLASAQLHSANLRLNETQVELAQAERDLKRNQELNARKLSSQQALDDARSRVAALSARVKAGRGEISVSQASLAVYQQELEDLTVRAPFSGMVVAKAAQPGEIVSPISAGGGFTRTGIGTIVDMNSLEVEIDVSESNIQKVNAGQSAEIFLNAYADEAIPGKVIAIIPTADRSKATVKVRVGFVTRDARALPEMGARVRFLAAEQSTPVAPPKGVIVSEQAVVNGQVFVIQDGKLQARSVKIAEKMGGSVRLTEGVNAGEQLATPTQGVELKDGLSIRTQ